MFLNSGTLTGPAVPAAAKQDFLVTPDWRDREFEALARITEMGNDLEDLDRFVGELEAAEGEYVDLHQSTIDEDSTEEPEWIPKPRLKNYSR